MEFKNPGAEFFNKTRHKSAQDDLDEKKSISPKSKKSLKSIGKWKIVIGKYRNRRKSQKPNPNSKKNNLIFHSVVAAGFEPATFAMWMQHSATELRDLSIILPSWLGFVKKLKLFMLCKKSNLDFPTMMFY